MLTGYQAILMEVVLKGISDIATGVQVAWPQRCPNNDDVKSQTIKTAKSPLDY
jgi:hypothetical protein